jgi:predicted ABC-class ATPase
MLYKEIPLIVEQALMWKNLDQDQCLSFVECVENQEVVRRKLNESGLVAFVVNGAVLPRESGISDRPLSGDQVVRFQAPTSLETQIEVPNQLHGGETVVRGLGIPKGVTLIVGGGYHGKSTLLKALEKCVYAHIPDDGREYVVTTKDAVKIRAEDGRRVESVNINPFITNLPQKISTDSFCSEDASGSTSQATNIMEALEVGANLLLLDEDTSATNFMVRDARMQELVHKDQEPITPFVDRVRELYDTLRISTVLVMGGSGDYFDVADHVIKMQDFRPHDVGQKVKDLVHSHPTERQVETPEPFGQVIARIPQAGSFSASRGHRKVKIEAQARDLMVFGSETVDLRYIDQLVESSQTRAVGHAIYLATRSLMSDFATLKDVVEGLEHFFDKNGLDALDPFYIKEYHPGNFSRPRKYEIAAAINRLRTVELRHRK